LAGPKGRAGGGERGTHLAAKVLGLLHVADRRFDVFVPGAALHHVQGHAGEGQPCNARFTARSKVDRQERRRSRWRQRASIFLALKIGELRARLALVHLRGQIEPIGS
jgi:hypothetical protein